MVKPPRRKGGECLTEFNRKCFACKNKLQVKRGEKCDFLYIEKENKFYHLSCFLKLQNVAKQCFKCKKDIILNQDKSLKRGNHFYHYDCFVKFCDESKVKKQRELKEYLDIFEEDAKKEIQNIMSSYNLNSFEIAKAQNLANEMVEQWYMEVELCNFICNKYNTTNCVYSVLREVFNGTYKNINKKIPPEHLLDMWKKKSDYLDKVYLNNLAQGKNFTVNKRIRYDIAVLVNKYDGYLKWLRQQELLKSNNKEKVDNLVLKSRIINSNENVTDIVNDDKDLLDEITDIFGEE